MQHNTDMYFSFFMFGSNFSIEDDAFLDQAMTHIRRLVEMGYTGFEFHPGREDTTAYAFSTYEAELNAYKAFRKRMDEEGFAHIKVATNVGATTQCDPSSADPAVRRAGIEYLKSRVDITASLGGEIMMGPMVIPYGGFVFKAPNGEAVWSDDLQDELALRYKTAQQSFTELGQYASSKGVKLAIEPISHWETPGPNKLAQLISFLDGIDDPTVGVVLDSAQETLDGDGPEVFAQQINYIADQGRLHYAQASPPDRGDLVTCWLPWEEMFTPILSRFNGPIAVEIFNAVGVFDQGLRLTRRKFWIPEVDQPNQYPDAYQIAKQAFDFTQSKLENIRKKLNLNQCK
ncbi:sugar phosphate isomerase/epimerase family protein [Pseudoalteromonas sp. Of7M-16]|uniref:sugar phosphate isomerase/epimerase family protein n=1 Tax=Pseudoalteromonas sp. Of7M-16 TaxID=2917756 RepID=UPI001EF497E6|nr:sugar phosphate isomerase/epimerase family protein [Pseudoalteromonas sp. Of7M-16]MCG7546837.1 sugar phosphate isomerase/epimerase [Pseudoalteromonas sp. Of7M-16]